MSESERQIQIVYDERPHKTKGNWTEVSAPFQAGLPLRSDGGRAPDARVRFDTFIRVVLEPKLRLLGARSEW